MSDEESFVILGTSPLSSLEPNGRDEVAESPDISFTSLKSSQLAVLSETLTNSDNSSVNSIKSMQAKTTDKTIDAVETSLKSNGKLSLSTMSHNGSANGKSVTSLRNGDGRDASLATSFLLGEINADVLKTSLYSQFPSVCSMEACAEDVVKLENFMAEYMELKNTLIKVNTTMKEFYNKTQQWREEMQQTEEEYKKQLQECQNQIATLRNENIDLKREVTVQREQLQITNDVHKKENADLLKAISEKSAIIENMRAQLDKLEHQQLASFEFVNNKNETEEKQKADYIERGEHQRITKNFERQMSELLAENLELKDMQKQYIDEITCLKVNLVSAEELIKEARADISLLKAKDMEKSETFSSYETERNNMREELTLLRQQVDVYSRDFEMERIARQNLAGEKDQLLTDLRILQRKNQELIEDAQKRLATVEHRSSYVATTAALVGGGNGSNSAFRASTSPSASTSSGSSAASVIAATPIIKSFEANNEQRPIRALEPPSLNAATGDQHVCPICYKYFKALNVLQSHVNDCLDKRH